MKELTVVIQAGGESRRMGQSKALIAFCGLPLICRSLRRLGGIADELIVTTNDPQSLSFLQDDVCYGKKLKLHRDVYDTRGALSGLYTALHYATKPYVGVVACDMVFPSAPLLEAERDALERSGSDLAVPHSSHGYEPFHAVYRRSTCLSAIKNAIERGESRANSWYDDMEVVQFDSDRVLKADSRGGAFINVNTPQELAAIEQRIMLGEMTKISDEIHG